MRGRALAGGCGLATACDLIVASDIAQFGYPETRIGFVPAMVMAILRRSVPEKIAFDMLTTGRILSAREAFEAGLVNRLVADVDLEGAGRTGRRPGVAIGLGSAINQTPAVPDGRNVIC